MASQKKIFEEICELINHKNKEDNKKAKKLGMKNSIKLGNLRKKFCKKCFESLVNSKTRINKKHRAITCGKCGNVNRWKLK